MRFNELVTGGAPAAEKGPTGSKAVNLLLSPLSNAIADQSQREEREETGSQNLKLQLAKLVIDEDLERRLQVSIEEFGIRLETSTATHPYGGQAEYTAMRGTSVDIALVQLPKVLFRTERGEAPYASNFVYTLQAFRDRTMRLFAEDTVGLINPFDSALEDQSRGADWRFIPWPNLDQFRAGRLEFWQALKMPRPSLNQIADSRTSPIGASERRRIIEVIASVAVNDYPTSRDAFRSFVRDSNWPDAWKQNIVSGWSNNAKTDAERFVDYMIDKGTYPSGHKLSGRSVLGESLRLFLTSAPLGGEQADRLARIIVEQRLVPDAEGIKSYYLE